MISFERVTKQYDDDITALDDITLTIHPGEFVSITGHSGSGKTTLLKMIWAEENPTSGKVYFGKDEIHRLPRHLIPEHRRRIGSVFQDYRLLPHKNVFENVAFMLEVSGRSDEDIMHDVPYALDLVNLVGKEHRYPHQLSAGEQQRLAIARAIIHQPQVLLADEPTGNLDPATADEIIAIFKKLNELGTTVILTTHSKQIVDSLARRVITLNQGRIIHDDIKGSYRVGSTMATPAPKKKQVSQQQTIEHANHNKNSSV
ncbi:cell division ATP-binding protein FtsE [Candidatus Nomurabacteria bacterium RIFCSPLOWO2_01_FULL_36_10b]|uniref:Cell division ATP-binding protein FtsE n=1 Tax=Candidatus Nomurabacteria bacterium RIFCSPLOWO2_01_FULL_36_10b TaxID=1801766 RepID=A0A1F6WNT5_9BACT|nr:MAG: cell division ATP-binding protein FtsE [Candidatus Nomurabacteria bacterium RIFCSPLOWO2_01_FULL_36_10b]